MSTILCSECLFTRMEPLELYNLIKMMIMILLVICQNISSCSSPNSTSTSMLHQVDFFKLHLQPNPKNKKKLVKNQKAHQLKVKMKNHQNREKVIVMMTMMMTNKMMKKVAQKNLIQPKRVKKERQILKVIKWCQQLRRMESTQSRQHNQNQALTKTIIWSHLN